MTVKSATMISWELDPLRTRGGTAFAVRRLADQLIDLGIETRVLLPDGPDIELPSILPGLLKVETLSLPVGLHRASRGRQCVEFCRAALAVGNGSDVFIAHSLEGAFLVVQRSMKQSNKPTVFWLHSLYDPILDDVPKDNLPCRTLLASAVTVADLVVTSSGILQDALEFEWPEQIKQLQEALKAASAEHRVLTVESIGCVPREPGNVTTFEVGKKISSPYVLFPGRPSVDKGFGFFVAIAERLLADNIACVAVRRPEQGIDSEQNYREAPVQWLPWLNQDELALVMRNAACVVLPSLTEGFGLAAAESIGHGATTLYQDIGGHRSLPDRSAIPLTPSERVQLYNLWTALFGSEDYWSVWSRHERSFEPLIDRWVEAIRTVVHNDVSKDPEVPAYRPEEEWGNKLIQRLYPSAFAVNSL
jgi:glycosyltransferase involved in cell wall biosynthesis